MTDTLPRIRQFLESTKLEVDSKMMQRSSVVLGGENRSSKIKVSPKIFNYTHNTKIVEGLTN